MRKEKWLFSCQLLCIEIWGRLCAYAKNTCDHWDFSLWIVQKWMNSATWPRRMTHWLIFTHTSVSNFDEGLLSMKLDVFLSTLLAELRLRAREGCAPPGARNYVLQQLLGVRPSSWCSRSSFQVPSLFSW